MHSVHPTLRPKTPLATQTPTHPTNQPTTHPNPPPADCFIIAVVILCVVALPGYSTDSPMPM